MTPEEFAKSINIPYKDHYPGLECPNCNKWQVFLDGDNNGKCHNCGEEFVEDDICNECQTLIKGNCFYCKMD